MRPPFIAWPGWPFLRFAWLLSAINGIWFEFVYRGCDWITAHRSLRVPISLPIELLIPLIRPAVLFYLSIYLLFIIGPFIIRGRREFAAVISSLALATLSGGIGFLLIPSHAAFAPAHHLGAWSGLFRFAQSQALEYNMVPSLHVALSVCCIAAYSRHASPAGSRLLWAWAAAIALSTLLTHQHHVIDVITGWAVGIASTRFAMHRLNLPRESLMHVSV